MKKAPNLTLDQKKAIENYTLVEKKTDAEIAKLMEIRVDRITMYRKKIGLLKGPGGNLGEKAKEHSRAEINKSNLSLEEKEEQWRAFFKHTKRYKKLSKLYSEYDLENFIEQWVNYHIGLEDMTNAEEDALEIMILHKIRLDANQATFNALQNRLIELDSQLSGKELDLENKNDLMIWEQITSINRQSTEVNKELKDLTDKYIAQQKSLNVSREQREQRQKVGADTFLKLVRDFNDRDRRAAAGKYNERMRLATEKQTQKLKRVHKFVDGSMEPILLDGADYIKKDEVNGTDKK